MENKRDEGVPVDDREAEFLARVIADEINEIGRRVIGPKDNLALHGRVWQKLTIWMLGSTVKLAQVTGMNAEELNNMVQDTLMGGLKLSERLESRWVDCDEKEKTN